ncbi:HDOD domain-containing protein [Sulfurimonas microaerophilic]|uniref:HDOD domain-containing protein n=1 Tax=Sulfurimonas microaerophilic TaxID=3058392 RepID=UPI002714579B|nr:HDOD domain-containing protein [Sulfurimonas sp. hsl 1-7]
MTFADIAQRIETLPSLSSIAEEIQDIYSGKTGDIDIVKLSKAIESDAMLTANILKMINSPYYGFKTKISSITLAITLLGARKIIVLVIHYALLNNVKADMSVYNLTNEQFNELCHLQSALMLQWFSQIDVQEAGFLSSLALIMEGGKLILAHEVIESEYTSEFRQGFNECENSDEYERELLGVTSYYISAKLFEHWNLDELYIKILEGLNEQECSQDDKKICEFIKALNIVRTAINVKEVLTEDSISKSVKLVEEMGYDHKYFEHTAYRLQAKYLNLNIEN